MFSGMDLFCAGPAQPLTTAGEELDDLQYTDHIDHDLSDLCSKVIRVDTPTVLTFSESSFACI